MHRLTARNLLACTEAFIAGGFVCKLAQKSKSRKKAKLANETFTKSNSTQNTYRFNTIVPTQI